MVFAHSVVRITTGLMDVTLAADQLRWHAFFPLIGTINDFVEQAQQFPEQHCSAVS